MIFLFLIVFFSTLIKYHLLSNQKIGVVTDKIVSMGDNNKEVKKKVFLPKYRVTDKIMSKAKDDAIFMHCLPAVRGEEVSESVIDGENSVIWQQVNNKLHMHKALIWSMLK